MHENSYNGDEIVARGASAVTGFVVGAVIGAGIALLLAPATGSDARRKLGEVARTVRDKANDRFGSVKDGLDHLKEDAKSAYEGGREAFRQSRQGTSSSTNPSTYSNPAA